MNKRYLLYSIILLFSLLICACKSQERIAAQKERAKLRKEMLKPKPKVTPSSSTAKHPTSSKQEIAIPLNSKDNKKLYSEIEKWLGTPHVTGGCSLSGIDCSCFVLTIYREVYGLDLYRSSVDMMKNTEMVKRNNLKEGDILFFKTSGKSINHVGIYLKNDYFAHTSTSKGVMISSLTEAYWTKCFFSGGRNKKVKTNY